MATFRMLEVPAAMAGQSIAGMPGAERTSQ